VDQWRFTAHRQATQPSGFAVNVASREEVRTFYHTVFLSSEGIPSGWSGEVATCSPGTTAADYRDATARRINYFRAMAGIPASIALDDTNNAKCQQAALMMSANNALSHTPPGSWICYTADGADAAVHSNLAIGNAGPDAISAGYMQDAGAGNTAVGHRRWILYPQTQTMGTGDVTPESGNAAANATWVFDANTGGPRPSTRDGFVSWPPPGYVPYSQVWNRWSFSYPDADFSSATVTMSAAGGAVPVTIEPIANGYGENTIVWYPSDLDPSAFGNWPKPAADTPYDISIQNVVIDGAPQAFNYTVTVFDPDTPGPDAVVPVVNGPDIALVNQPNTYTFNPVPGATGYEYRQSQYAALTDVDGAEAGLVHFSADVSPGYAVVVNSPVASGSAAFHLAHPMAVNQTLTFNGVLLPRMNAQLQFKSRLGVATTSQVATVEVLIDGATTWTAVYQQAGTDDAGETTFATRTVSLAAYADRAIHVRFSYVFTGGSYYPQTTAGVGWYIDDIAFTNTDEVTSSLIIDVPTGTSFSFTPSQTGGYALQVRPQFYGSYYLDFGPIKRVLVAWCTGDCDENGHVTVSQIIVMVRIALGGANVSACPAGDTNNDGTITVEEILAAVRYALSGCLVP